MDNSLPCFGFDELKYPTISELAASLQIAKPSTSIMLDKLEDHGYLQKVKSVKDLSDSETDALCILLNKAIKSLP